MLGGRNTNLISVRCKKTVKNIVHKVIYHETIQTVETPFSEILLLNQESLATIVRFIRFLGGLRDRREQVDTHASNFW